MKHYRFDRGYNMTGGMEGPEEILNKCNLFILSLPRLIPPHINRVLFNSNFST